MNVNIKLHLLDYPVLFKEF